MVKKIVKGLLLVIGGIGCFLVGYLAKAYDLAGVEGDQEEEDDDTDDLNLDDDPNPFDEPVAPPFPPMGGDFDGNSIVEVKDPSIVVLHEDNQEKFAEKFNESTNAFYSDNGIGVLHDPVLDKTISDPALMSDTATTSIEREDSGVTCASTSCEAMCLDD